MTSRSTPKKSLVLVSGPPGVGKTHLTKALYANLKKRENNESRACKIHYDDVLDRRIESELIRQHEWKSSGRDSIRRLVEHLINWLEKTPSSIDSSPIDAASSSSIRSDIRANFARSIGDDYCHLESGHFVIILDDVFYYASMRHAFYRLCVDSAATSFYSICLRPRNDELARQRNRSRPADTRVDESSFDHILAKFEYPDETEPFTRLISVDVDTVIDDRLISSIWNDIRENHERFVAMLHSLRSVQLQKASDAQATAASLAHQCDLILRRLIAEKIASVADRAEISRLASTLTARKAQLLADIKNPQSDLHSKLVLLLNDISLVENELRISFFL